MKGSIGTGFNTRAGGAALFWGFIRQCLIGAAIGIVSLCIGCTDKRASVPRKDLAGASVWADTGNPFTVYQKLRPVGPDE